MKIKILFVGNKFIGSNTRISRLLNNKFENKVLAYYKYSDDLNIIDWNLNVLDENPINFFNNKEAPKCNKYYTEFIIDEIGSWNPNLIISDLEPISAYIAKLLNIKLWYVSPLVSLFDMHKKLPGYLKLFQNKIRKYPKADKYLIYYPIIISNNFDHIITQNKNVNLIQSNSIKINKKGNEIMPFFKTNFVLNGGETDYISDAIHNDKKIYIISKYQDIESMFNCYILNNNSVNLGTIQSSNDFINLKLECDYNYNYTLVKNRIENYVCSI